jgi:hypothetical protein
MITLKTLEIAGFAPAVVGMRNPKNSWERSDSIFHAGFDENAIILGENDRKLALQLALGGPVHAKYRRMIQVWVNITAPLYWWKEFDTYKVGTVGNSCSTMHKIHEKEFTLDDFSHEHLTGTSEAILIQTIGTLNMYRNMYNTHKDKEYWWQMIQLLPTSYNQKRTINLNYEVLANIYQWRRGHKLDEWAAFIEWAEKLPYSEIFMMGV